jgi:hypothetical protein
MRQHGIHFNMMDERLRQEEILVQVLSKKAGIDL